jgi:MarR family transcriptional regulator, transcriptional regulator for hemolysin
MAVILVNEEHHLKEQQQYVFGSLFLLANKLQIKGDKFLSEDHITLRQWLLTVLILQCKDRHPTLGEVAKMMGTSHQNVKQLANKLMERGFLEIEKDKVDARVIRLKLTEKSFYFWLAKEKENDRFMANLFEDLSTEEVSVMARGFQKLLNKIEGWEI